MRGDIVCVVGARPNFMKVAPLVRALRAAGLPHRLVHTEQHYDAALSKVFFEELEIPPPHVSLGVGSGSHADQTARVMLAFEPVLLAKRPACVIVVGDVNSTVACALVAAKLGIPVVHVEAGLRSFDRTMPEELNRIVTDQLADLCLTPSGDADENLRREGIAGARVRCVGNVMIDSVVHALPRAQARGTLARLGLAPGGYVLATLHRPSNVDSAESLGRSMRILREVGALCPVIFPVHPRTRERLARFGLDGDLGNGAVRLLEPVGYLDCLALEEGARLVLTDSGGIQEETTFLGIPCLTLRENTERPVTVDEGTNRVVGTDPARVLAEARAILSGKRPLERRAPAMWDGHTAERIVDCVSALGVGADGDAGVSASASA